MRERLREFYLTFDLRFLALFRMALALLLLQDALALWPHLGDFFTSSGVLPAEIPWPRAGGRFHFSVLDPLHSTAAVRAAFVAGMLAHVALLAGFRTRIAQILSLVFFASVGNRNPLLSHGAGSALTVLCLWGLMMPLGARWSLDARRARRRQPRAQDADVSAPTWVALAYAAQIGLIYLSTAATKTGEAWRDGTAIYYALHLDQYSTALGLWFGEWPLPLLQALSHLTIGLEWAALPMFLLPWGQPWLRRIAILGLAGFHLGTAVTMTLGAFAFVMLASYLPLLRARDRADLLRVWRWIRRRGAGEPGAPALPSRVLAPARLAVRRGIEVAAAFIIVCSLFDAYNGGIRRRLGTPPVQTPLVFRAPGLALDLGRGWQLFAPEPWRHDGWWVVTGTTTSGAAYDPLSGHPPDWNKPPRLAHRYGVHWRIYLTNISKPESRLYQILFAHYLAGRTRDVPPSQKLEALDLWWVQEDTPPPATPPPPLQRFRLWSWDAEHDAIRRGDV